VLKNMHTSWRGLGGLSERLWVGSGQPAPPTCGELLPCCRPQLAARLRVSLGELAGGQAGADSTWWKKAQTKFFWGKKKSPPLP